MDGVLFLDLLADCALALSARGGDRLHGARMEVVEDRIIEDFLANIGLFGFCEFGQFLQRHRLPQDVDRRFGARLRLEFGHIKLGHEGLVRPQTVLGVVDPERHILDFLGLAVDDGVDIMGDGEDVAADTVGSVGDVLPDLIHRLRGRVGFMRIDTVRDDLADDRIRTLEVLQSFVDLLSFTHDIEGLGLP